MQDAQSAALVSVSERGVGDVQTRDAGGKAEHVPRFDAFPDRGYALDWDNPAGHLTESTLDLADVPKDILSDKSWIPVAMLAHEIQRARIFGAAEVRSYILQ